MRLSRLFLKLVYLREDRLLFVGWLLSLLRCLCKGNWVLRKGRPHSLGV